MSLKEGFLLNGVFLIASFVTKIKAGLQKVRVFMPKVLLGEILGNQIGKNAIFHIKKSFKSLQSLHGILTKNSRKSPKFGQKEGEKSIFLENSLS